MLCLSGFQLYSRWVPPRANTNLFRLVWACTNSQIGERFSKPYLHFMNNNIIPRAEYYTIQ